MMTTAQVAAAPENGELQTHDAAAEGGCSHHRGSGVYVTRGGSYMPKQTALLHRLRRIEGQARGVAHMIEDGRHCVDIVQQLQALSSAADEVALLIVREHVRGCLVEAIQERRGEEAIDELMGTLRRMVHR